MPHTFMESGRFEGTSGSPHPDFCRSKEGRKIRIISRRGVNGSKDGDSTASQLGPLFQDLTASEKFFSYISS